MGDSTPGTKELADIRRLAADPAKVTLTTTAKYDLMSAGLTKNDICDEIITWIDKKQRVKKVILRGKHAGQPAYEIKPQIDKTLFYLKLTLCDLGKPHELMLVVSAHPDH
jgi:hypothetical protein